MRLRVYGLGVKTSTLMFGLALAAAFVVSGVLVFAETYSTLTCTPEGCVSGSSTLIEENGTWVLAVLALPAMLVLATIGAVYLAVPRGIPWGLAAFFLGACLISAASVGIAYLPAAGLLIIALALSQRNKAQPPEPVRPAKRKKDRTRAAR